MLISSLSKVGFFSPLFLKWENEDFNLQNVTRIQVYYENELTLFFKVCFFSKKKWTCFCINGASFKPNEQVKNNDFGTLFSGVWYVLIISLMFV